MRLKQPETSNTYGLPRGEKIRREQVAVFRRQRAAILRYLKTGKKDDLQGPLPSDWPTWHEFGLGAIEASKRFTPLIQALWQDGGEDLYARIGFDPDEWSVTNPHTEGMIERAALDLCEETQATTSLQLDEALAKTRSELIEGIIKQGESLAKLTERVNSIFDGAEKWRARRIAVTEASRAVHAAGEQAAIESGVVTGWELLLSSDACPLCQTIARRCPRVKLGQPFAVIGDNPNYSHVRFPPLHAQCQCTVTEVLDTDVQPEWSQTLVQPKPEPEDIPDDEDEDSKQWRMKPKAKGLKSPVYARKAGRLILTTKRSW